MRRFLLRQKIVPCLHIEGPVTELVVSSVGKYLNGVNVSRISGLGFVVNSSGGSPTQCNQLRTKLLSFSQSNNIPLIAFSERHALSGGYYVLSAGQEIYVNENSVIGHLGVQRDWKIFKKSVNEQLQQEEGIDEDKLTTEYQYDILGGLRTEKEREWAAKTIEAFNQKMIQDVLDERSGKLKAGDWILGKICYGQKAEQFGLVDGLGECKDMLRKKFPSAAIQEVYFKSKYELFVEKVHRYAVLFRSRAFVVIASLFLLKVIVKWTLIFYLILNKGDSSAKELPDAKQPTEDEKRAREQKRH